jgi:hypothetical protein
MAFPKGEARLVPPFYGAIKGEAWPLDSSIDFTLP